MEEQAKATLILDPEHHRLTLRQYGVEGARLMAINMCDKQGLEMTEENLYGCLSNLESGLREMFA